MKRISLRFSSRGLVAAVAVAVMAFGTTTAPIVAAGGIRNCVDVTGKHIGRVGCYEDVWSGGVQYRMTFANQSYSGAKPTTLDRFYIVAPQTASPQGPVSYFPHDHVVRDIPGDGGTTTLQLAGFLVLCSEQGLVSGSCTAVWLSLGGPSMPFAEFVDGHQLTSTAAIESAADAGDVNLVDLGPTAVIVGSINQSK